MMTELRGGVMLMASLLFFLFIVAVLALGTVMKPRRWSERSRSVA